MPKAKKLIRNIDFKNKKTRRGYVFDDKYGRAIFVPLSYDQLDTLIELLNDGRYTPKDVAAALLFYSWATVLNYSSVAYFRVCRVLHITLDEVPFYAEKAELLGVRVSFDKSTKSSEYHRVNLEAINGVAQASFNQADMPRDVKLYLMPPHSKDKATAQATIAFLKANACLTASGKIPKAYRDPFIGLGFRWTKGLVNYARGMYDVLVPEPQEIGSGRQKRLMVVNRLEEHPDPKFIDDMLDQLGAYILARIALFEKKGKTSKADKWCRALDASTNGDE